MPDLECTWWPDIWFGFNLQPCCEQHDLGGSDWSLFLCVLELLPWWADWVAGLMLAGMTLFGWIYRASQKRKKSHD